MTPEQYVQLGLDMAARACEKAYEFKLVHFTTPLQNSTVKLCIAYIREIDPTEILKQKTEAAMRQANNAGRGE